MHHDFENSSRDRLKYIIISPILIVSTDFQQCGILTSVDSDDPVRPLLKLRNSKWCSGAAKHS